MIWFSIWEVPVVHSKKYNNPYSGFPHYKENSKFEKRIEYRYASWSFYFPILLDYFHFAKMESRKFSLFHHSLSGLMIRKHWIICSIWGELIFSLSAACSGVSLLLSYQRVMCLTVHHYSMAKILLRMNQKSPRNLWDPALPIWNLYTKPQGSLILSVVTRLLKLFSMLFLHVSCFVLSRFCIQPLFVSKLNLSVWKVFLIRTSFFMWDQLTTRMLFWF